MLRLVLPVGVAVASLAFFATTESPKFKDPQVKLAHDRFEQAKNGYRLALEKGVAEADRKGEDPTPMLNELAVLNAEDPSDATLATVMPNSLVGRWKFTYDNRTTRTYLIGKDGGVRFIEEKLEGRIVMRDGEALVDFGDNKIERLTLTPAIKLEHFNPASSYRRGAPVALGTGVLVD